MLEIRLPPLQPPTGAHARRRIGDFPYRLVSDRKTECLRRAVQAEQRGASATVCRYTGAPHRSTSPNLLPTCFVERTVLANLRCVIAIWTLLLIPQLVNGQQVDSADKDYAAELPRIAAKSLEEAQRAIEVLDGFQLELVAAEPLVTDPVAFAFDARGRLFVVEMRDYSEQETEHLGRIALLTDEDGDGQMDHRATFVEGLSWPTAIWPWQDGVLVAEPPRITWYRDTDDDLQSDHAEDWFTGFGRGNVQGLVNSLRWGVDGLIHGATSSAGAEIELVAQAGGTLPLGRRDFAIDPLTKTMQAESGGGQHGLSFNRWGDKFVTSNSDHLQQIIDLDSWLAQHSAPVPMPSTRRSIAEDGPQAEVFRSSPVEPWRIVRTRLRVSGVAPGVVEGGGRAAGYFTGATGTWIMDGEQGFGDSGTDTALVCDVGSNLIHRKRLIDNGLFWTASRIDEQSELVRSRDTWFRPVQLGDGPDGALYIADMAREVIEHPKSLPPMIKKHLDLTSGRDRGRIWRISRSTSHASAAVDMASLSSSALVSRLEDPIAWRRRMASQLLVERQAVDVRDELNRLAGNSELPESRILALHLIHRLGMFSGDVARTALQDQHPRVLEHALNLVRQAGLTQALPGELVTLATHEAPRVQLALAEAAAELDDASRQAVLAPMLAHVSEPLVRATLATAAGNDSWQLLRSSELAQTDSAGFASWLRLLLPVWSRQAGSKAALAAWIKTELEPESKHFSVWLDALRQLPDRRAAVQVLRTLPAAQWSAVMDRIEQHIADTAQAERLSWLGLLPTERQTGWLERWLTPSIGEQRQTLLIRAADWAGHPQLPELLIERFTTMTPAVQQEALRVLSSRKASSMQLAAALESGKIRRSHIPPALRQQLVSDRDPQVAQAFQALLEQVAADRQKLIADYARELDTNAPRSIDAGRQVFARVCAQCHRIDAVGNDVGPPLKQLADKSPRQLLETILDPNGEVDPKYASYSVLLEDGRVLAGIIREETPAQLILVEAGGTVQTVLRDEIEQLKSNGISFMPVGLEEQVSPQQMAALIEYLRSVGG